MIDQTPFTDEGQNIGIGAHVCAMHEASEAVLDVLARTFATGLKRGERCVYVAPESAAVEVRRSLAEAGTDVEAAESGGDLIFMTDRDPLLKNGTEFDPDHVLDALKGLFAATVEAGYPALRFSADVPWLTRDIPGGDRAMEFETKADEIINVPGMPLLAICQYRLGELDPEDSLSILERHLLTLVGGRIHVNDRYTG